MIKKVLQEEASEKQHPKVQDSVEEDIKEEDFEGGSVSLRQRSS